MLKELHLKHVGPAEQFDLELGSRLNILTGDNGLGKTFLLDAVWFALTNTWSSELFYPLNLNGERPSISFQVESLIESKSTDNNKPKQKKIASTRHFTSTYNPRFQTWGTPAANEIPSIKTPGIVIYSQMNSHFTIWDAARHHVSYEYHIDNWPKFFSFNSNQVWNGLNDGSHQVWCNGLIRDWLDWQYKPNQSSKSPFNLLRQVLKKLSPPDVIITPDSPARISKKDARDIPTINLGYQTTPITFASAGMRRILSLAYMIVWAWHEHVEVSKIDNEPTSSNIVLLIDEIEAHLHPQWQRVILPSILEVVRILDPELKLQLILTTHSPLILASAEPHFTPETDKLFHLDLVKYNSVQPKVELNELHWEKQGDATAWLESAVFDETNPHSIEAEQVIRQAEAYIAGKFDTMTNADKVIIEAKIEQSLYQYLPSLHPILVDWKIMKGLKQNDSGRASS